MAAPRLSGPARLVYLGFAFPPGMAALHPARNPAGHALETQMLSELRPYFDIRSVGVLPVEPVRLETAAPGSGIEHELILLEKPPELLHRLRSLARLKAQYRLWLAQGWQPDAVLVYNLSPIYNQFLLWLRRQADCPKLVLLLLDSANLGRRLPWLKRLRRRLKPMCVPDAEMLRRFDACVTLSQHAERHFRSTRIPLLWMPGGCNPARARFDEHPAVPTPSPLTTSGTLHFGYFGSLGAHAGVEPLVETFLANNFPATLHLCGYGKLSEKIAARANRDSRLAWHGLLPPDHCLRFGRACHVLVNPRPATHGNENNFASKLFDYALTGSAILTSRMSGVEDVLGPEAFYFDPHDFCRSLTESLRRAASTPRAELQRRGSAIQHRVLTSFSWERQAARLAEFLEKVCIPRAEPVEAAEALAA